MRVEPPKRQDANDENANSALAPLPRESRLERVEEMDRPHVPSLASWRLGGLILSGIDLLLGVAVVGLVAFATAAFGTVKPWSEAVVMWIGLGIAAGLALRVLLAGGLPRTAAYGAMAAYLLLAALQMIALPDWLMAIISPQTLADKTRLLSDLPGAAERLRHVTITYYLFGTHHDLRIVLLDALVFLAVLAIARSPRRILAMLIGFSIVAAALATVALLQDIRHAPNILWINGQNTLTTNGPFVNHSDFSQQMNQLSGWALALILVAATVAWPRNRWGRGWRIAGICLLAITVIGGIVATLNSLSRGGEICMVLGGIMVLIGLAMRRGKGSMVWLIVVIACLAIGAALFSGFNTIYARMRSIERSGEYASRLANDEDILGISRRYPLVGVGLGSHAVFFPRYESNAGFGRSTHAENEYAQALEETGYIGLACIVIFAGIVWVYWKRGAANAAEPIAIAAIGLGFGLAAVESQSFADFGQHLPALGCLTAATCAMMIRLGGFGAPSAGETRSAARSSKDNWVLAIAGRGALAVIVLAAAGWSALGAYRDKQADDLMTGASAAESFMEDNPWGRTPQTNREVLSDEQAAVRKEPLNVDYYLWQGWDRWAALTTPLGTGTPAPRPGFVPSETIDPDHPNLAEVQRAADALDAARWVCPTYGPICTLAGQIELDPLHEPIGAARVRLGAELAPHDITSLNVAARLDAREGLWDQAAQLFRILLTVRPDFSGEVVSFYVGDMHRPDMALAVEPNDYRYLQFVASSTTDANVRRAAAARVKDLLIAACNGLNPTGDELAALAEIRQGDGDLRSAADLYKRAIGLKYDQVGWHLSLAEVLLQLNDRAGAQSEAGICLHLQPGMPGAQAVLDALSSTPMQ